MPDKSIKSGTAWTLLFFLSSFAKTLVLTPLMLVSWGERGFSFWAIILSVRAVALFLTDGYVRYTANRYNLLFHNDPGRAGKILSSGISFLLVFSFLLCGLPGMAVVFFPPVSALLFGVEGGSESLALLSLCLLAYLFAASIQSVQRMLSATKEARGQVAQNMMMEVVLVLTELLTLSLLLIGGCDVYTGILADSLLVTVIAIGYSLHLLHRYPLKGLLSREMTLEGSAAFLQAGKLYAGNFFEKLCTDGLVLLLSLFRFDKMAIALFATVRTMVNTPVLAQNLLLNTYTPELQRKFTLRDDEGLQSLFRRVRLHLAAPMLLGIVCCFPLYEPVFIFWTKGKLAYNESFMVGMLLLTISNLYGTSFAFVLKGLNLLPELLRVMLLKTVLVLLAFACSGADIVQLGMWLAAVELLCSVLYLPAVLQEVWRREHFGFTYRQSLLALWPYLLAALSLLLIHAR